MEIRASVFAGTWYPADPEACRRQIQAYFEEGPPLPELTGEAIGGIVPHAGWAFSGRIAGQVFCRIRDAFPPETVILFGGHLGPGDEHLIMAEGGWDSPFGPLEVDQEMAEHLLNDFVLREEKPRRAQPDNTRELQIPLIGYSFPGARILPLAIAPTKEGIHIGAQCARLAIKLGRKVKVIGSTDLTHYGYGYGFAPKGSGSAAEKWVREEQDPQIIKEMEKMDPDGILREAMRHQNACCPGAVASAIACMNQLGAHIPQVVSYSTSLDVYPGDDFVGYVGIVYWLREHGRQTRLC
jgi:AmmeMemoRadiSam system protein B